MKHLTGEQLVDVAEGTRSEGSLPHLASCAECRARLVDMRAMMSTLEVADVPEPSPLFWDRLSNRISEAVANAGAPSRVPWRVDASGWRALFRPAILVSIAAAAAVVIVAFVAITPRRSAVAVQVPTLAERAVPSESAEGTAMLPPDDPALDMVASLGTGLDWDEVHDSGIVAHTGLVDRAVSGLSASERAELGKLLKQELTGGGN